MHPSQLKMKFLEKTLQTGKPHLLTWRSAQSCSSRTGDPTPTLCERWFGGTLSCMRAQSAFKETPDVKGFLFNPVVADQKKRDLLSSLANDAGLSKHTLNFLNLLLDQARQLLCVSPALRVGVCVTNSGGIPLDASAHCHAAAGVDRRRIALPCMCMAAAHGLSGGVMGGWLQDRLMAIQEIFDAFEIQYCKLTDTQVRAACLQLCMLPRMHALRLGLPHSLPLLRALDVVDGPT